MPQQTRKDFLERLGRDPANPQAEPSYSISQVPAFNTGYGLSSMRSPLPAPYSTPYGNTPLGPYPAFSSLAPQVPAPTQGLLVPGTITNLFDRPPYYHNPAETPDRPPEAGLLLSNTISTSFTDENPRSPYFRKEVLVPTVVNGKLLSNQEAMRRYYQTGEHLGAFDTPENAERYANWLHGEQTRRLGVPPE